MISATALTNENIVTCAAGGELMKLSLKNPRCGSRWAAVKPTALAKPTAIAAQRKSGLGCCRSDIAPHPHGVPGMSDHGLHSAVIRAGDVKPRAAYS